MKLTIHKSLFTACQVSLKLNCSNSSNNFRTQIMPGKVVFATVGTTKFDFFISIITEEAALKELKKRGYDNLIIQIGNGSVLPNEENCKNANMNLTYYRFKNSIQEDILKADLIISHAGAGTCLEVLDAKKPLLVVVNEELMHNHQTELADQLSSENYLFACTCTNLVKTIAIMNPSKLKKMPPVQPNLFANYLNEFSGFHQNSGKPECFTKSI